MLAERKASVLAIKRFYLRVIDDHEKLKAKATAALQIAQAELDRVESQYSKAPEKIAWCEEQLKQINVQHAHEVLLPKLEKLKELYAKIAELEAE